MNWKKIVAEYFTFTRGNRIAILTILIIIAGVFFLPDFLSKKSTTQQTTKDTTWIATMKRIEQREPEKPALYSNYNDENSNNYQYDRNSSNYYPNSKGGLFYFDPNTISPEGWRKLGLREKTIGTIQNYLRKGGKFKKPEDVSKIYGLFPNEYERIAPYIKIQVTENTNSYTNYTDPKEKEEQPAKNYSKTYSIVNINTANTDDLIALPGIGPTFSSRIINFREKLGGFYSINQVAETYGLPDSTFQKIKQYLTIENAAIKKININSCNLEELKAHPYLKWSIANAIIAYRNEHGPFSRLEDLKKIMIIDDVLFLKVSPYFTVQ